jgi:DNA mismatch repair protein MutL
LESERQSWQQQFRAPPVVAPPLSAPTNEPRPSTIPTMPPSIAPAPSERELPQLERDFGLRGQRSVEFVPPRGGSDSANRQRETVSKLEREETSLPRMPQQFQIIGVLNKLYVLMENANGLVLVDQHAAHERILFEELRRRMEEQGVPSQKLLLPQTFDLPPRDAEWIERNVETLQKMGIGIESFGPNTFKIDSLPQFVTAADGVQFMQSVIDELKNASNSSSPLRLGEDMIAKTVCRHAVKANDPLQYPELEKLIQDLLECDLPYCCPHGRPTMIQISLDELEKKFGRKA